MGEKIRANLNIDREMWGKFKRFCKQNGENAAIHLRRYVYSYVRSREGQAETETPEE